MGSLVFFHLYTDATDMFYCYINKINSIKQLTTVSNCYILFMKRRNGMKIIINHSSMQPIYEQIAGQMKAQILKGEIKEDTMLPSVRMLAKEQRISALTVKKAYDTLEAEGFITTVHGKGSFVAPTNRQMRLEERRKEVEAAFELAIRKGKSCGMSKEELTDVFQMILEEM